MKNEDLILKSDAETGLMPHVLSPLFLHLTKTRQAASPIALSASGMKSARRAIALPSNLSTARIRRLAHEAESSHMINLPFASTVALCVMTGLLAIGCGIAVRDISQTVAGFTFTLIGSALYGSNLSDD